ncbi:YfiR family protein [Brevundimonas viscosa]|uniref:YfiR family protein n=1 Tax=Brevundimonas viscosa TaxID=871741 RepID=A0A1I6NS51_9CAUL|nr:YfiR family protein [Brevundimonas viscosa]SFS30836.1 protein of unknown function [Brevundimonas viscosa]
MAGRQAIAGALAALVLLGEAGMARAQTLEYQVKANYLVRFAAFVEWPPSAFASASAPLTLCVAGRDPFGRALETAAAAQTAHGRRIALRRLGDRSAVTGCHIVYLGRGAEAPETGAAVLVVSDSAVTARRAMIHFVISSNRVRFHIDKVAAEQARLQLSSRLLNLAVDVRGRG